MADSATPETTEKTEQVTDETNTTVEGKPQRTRTSPHDSIVTQKNTEEAGETALPDDSVMETNNEDSNAEKTEGADAVTTEDTKEPEQPVKPETVHPTVEDLRIDKINRNYVLSILIGPINITELSNDILYEQITLSTKAAINMFKVQKQTEEKDGDAEMTVTQKSGQHPEEGPMIGTVRLEFESIEQLLSATEQLKSALGDEIVHSPRQNPDGRLNHFKQIEIVKNSPWQVRPTPPHVGAEKTLCLCDLPLDVTEDKVKELVPSAVSIFRPRFYDTKELKRYMYIAFANMNDYNEWKDSKLVIAGHAFVMQTIAVKPQAPSRTAASLPGKKKNAEAHRTLEQVLASVEKFDYDNKSNDPLVTPKVNHCKNLISSLEFHCSNSKTSATQVQQCEQKMRDLQDRLKNVDTSKISKVSCFNCGEEHHLNDCPVPKDQDRIAENLRTFRDAMTTAGPHKSVSKVSCFNCGEEHHLNDCTVPKDQDRIAENLRTFRDAMATAGPQKSVATKRTQSNSAGSPAKRAKLNANGAKTSQTKGKPAANKSQPEQKTKSVPQSQKAVSSTDANKPARKRVRGKRGKASQNSENTVPASAGQALPGGQKTAQRRNQQQWEASGRRPPPTNTMSPRQAPINRPRGGGTRMGGATMNMGGRASGGGRMGMGMGGARMNMGGARMNIGGRRMEMGGAGMGRSGAMWGMGGNRDTYGGSNLNNVPPPRDYQVDRPLDRRVSNMRDNMPLDITPQYVEPSGISPLNRRDEQRTPSGSTDNMQKAFGFLMSLNSLMSGKEQAQDAPRSYQF